MSQSSGVSVSEGAATPLRPLGLVSRLQPIFAGVRGAATSLLWSAASLSLLLLVWQAVCVTIGKDLPTPVSTYGTLVEMLSDPFNPDRNSLGVGLQLWASLQRVAIGFGIGSAIAIPLGV